jgi:hypothetical protein
VDAREGDSVDPINPASSSVEYENVSLAVKLDTEPL